MNSILVSFVTLLLSTGAFASQIQMYDNKAPLSLTPVDKVIVQGPEIYVRSAIHACSHYPGFPDKIFGDVYECYTSRQRLSQHLNDMNVLSLPDTELSKYLIALHQTFSCENRGTPNVVPYQGKNVYWFSGILLTVQ